MKNRLKLTFISSLIFLNSCVIDGKNNVNLVSPPTPLTNGKIVVQSNISEGVSYQIDNYSLPSIYYSKPVELKPAEHFPANMEIMKSMNNVGLIKHNNKYYMGLRTAPSHFPSEKAIMYILSSDDANRWVLEKTFKMGGDLREPNFLSLKGRLFFYFFKGGSNPLKFDPQDMYLSEMKSEGNWTEPKKFFEPGYVNWRPRVFNGKAYMTVYYGKDLYGSQKNSKIYLLVSDDGENWKPISDKPQVIGYPGAEEPEFEFDNEGNIWGTIRLENNGGMIFYADKNSLDKWNLYQVKDKYDSALMLNHRNEMYVFARRNVDGSMDKAPKFLPDFARKWINLIRYSLTKKRTALYYLDKNSKTLKPLFDFPSHGDTAFPALAPIDDKRYLFLNYSSVIFEGNDFSWIRGQLSTTRIYSSIITFSK